MSAAVATTVMVAGDAHRLPRPPKLTAKQQRFVTSYAATGNGARSAREAGYRGTDASLRVQGARLLSNANVRAAIGRLAARDEATKIASREERLVFLTRVVRGEEVEEVPTKDGLVQSAPRLKERIRAAELIARMNGELVDKAQIRLSGHLTLEALPAAIQTAVIERRRARGELPAGEESGEGAEPEGDEG